MASTAEATTAALVASVHAIDGARRAGWAKAYAAEESLDDVLRDLNIARADIAATTRFAGLLYGLVTIIAPHLIGRLPSDHMGVMTMLPAAGIAAGQRLGRRSGLGKGYTPPNPTPPKLTPPPVRDSDEPPWGPPEQFDADTAWKLIQNLRTDLAKARAVNFRG